MKRLLPIAALLLLAWLVFEPPSGMPAAAGDAVEFAGEYEWNPRGGGVHWTHDDPRGRHPGGRLAHAGGTFR